MSRFAKKAQLALTRSAHPNPARRVRLPLAATHPARAGRNVGRLCRARHDGLSGEAGNARQPPLLPVILSTSLLTFAYTIRNSMVLPSLAELRRNPRDPKLLKRWSRNNLIVQSLCAAVGLTGFAMQLLGAATPLALTLYAIAVGYLFLLRPLRP